MLIYTVYLLDVLSMVKCTVLMVVSMVTDDRKVSIFVVRNYLYLAIKNLGDKFNLCLQLS